MHLFNLFLPLVLKGQIKKVITISTGMADLDLINNCEVDIAGLYAASKAAMNVIVAKFNAQYKKDGVLFLSISPGLVEVGRFANSTCPFPPCHQETAASGHRCLTHTPAATPEEAQGLTGFMGNLIAYAPHFEGPITPEESVRHIRSTWEKASIEGGFGGAFISHLGNKQWV